MKKIIAALILTVAAAAPAFASDGSEVVTRVQPSNVAMSNDTAAYASTRAMNWQPTQDMSVRYQDQTQSGLFNR